MHEFIRWCLNDYYAECNTERSFLQCRFIDFLQSPPVLDHMHCITVTISFAHQPFSCPHYQCCLRLFLISYNKPDWYTSENVIPENVILEGEKPIQHKSDLCLECFPPSHATLLHLWNLLLLHLMRRLYKHTSAVLISRFWKQVPPTYRPLLPANTGGHN